MYHSVIKLKASSRPSCVSSLLPALLFSVMWSFSVTTAASEILVSNVSSENSNKIATGDRLTIGGSGFGEREHYGGAEFLNYRFENGEAGVVDNHQLMNSWGSVSNDNNRPGSQYNILHERGAVKTYQPITQKWGSNRTNRIRYSLSVDVKNQTPVHQYFASAWVRLSDDFNHINLNKYNSTSLISFQPDRSNITTSIVGGGSVGVTAAKNPAELTVSTGSGELTKYHGSILEKLKPGSWHRLDGWVSVNDETTGYTDEVKFWLDGKLIIERKQAGFRQTEFPAMKGVHFVSYMKNLNSDEAPWSVQTDDHYVDFTQARIEIGNADKFSETTHREIQIPTQWNDNAIEMIANLGAFQPEDDLYVYVVNAHGEVNENGYALATTDKEDSSPIIINFQPANATPAAGYLVDSGNMFADRGNGYSYGWSNDISASARDRNNLKAKDQRYDTLLHMLLPSQGYDASWEIELANGNYTVHLVCGDLSYSSDSHYIDIEGVPFIAGALKSGVIENTQSVNVNDGRLTLTSTTGATSNKVMFIEIIKDDGRADTTPPDQATELLSSADDGQISLSWKNPLYSFVGSIVVYSTQPITELPVAGSDYAGVNYMGGAKVNYIGAGSQTLIGDLINDQKYYVKVFSFDEAFNYSESAQLEVTPFASSSREQERERSLAAMENLTTGNTPEAVYAIYNRFAKVFFGAQAAPIVYQLYGDELKIEAGSEWVHTSERSAAIAWQTNLPADSYIEYGLDTQYGNKTEMAERAFYTHNHYLKNLQPQSVYQYRLVSIDERGNTHYSENRQLSTQWVAGAIRIPDDMPGGAPYLLDSSDVTYVVTEDIEAESGVFKITGENVILDLGGHTITHATRLHDNYNGRDMNDNGMAIWRLNYPATAGKLTIVNGTIKQGAAANIGGNYGGYNAIVTSDQDDLEVAGISFDYHTAQTYAMYMSFSGNFQYPEAEYNIHHNAFKDRGWHIVNRHGKTGGRSVLFTGSIPKQGNNFKLHNNLVKRTRQNALMGATSVKNNEIYVDSWSTNSFAIQPYSMPGQDAGDITGNRIFLTGYHAIGASWAHENLNVSNNFIHMEGINSEKNRWWESFGDQNSLNGLRITNYGSGGQIRNDLVYSDNTIIGTARHGSLMRGTEFFSDYSIAGTRLENSTISLYSDDMETTRVSPVVTQGTSNLGHLPTVYSNSTLSSNITNVSFGDSYGRGYNHQFHNVHFEKVGDEPDYHTFTFDGGYSRDGHVLRDCTFSGGAAWDDVNWLRTGNLSAYSVEWTLTVTSANNTHLKIYDANNVLVHEGAIAGAAQIPLTQATIRPVEWTPAATGGGVKLRDQHQKIMATPHTLVFIDSQGVEQRQVINMQAPMAIAIY